MTGVLGRIARKSNHLANLPEMVRITGRRLSRVEDRLVAIDRRLAAIEGDARALKLRVDALAASDAGTRILAGECANAIEHLLHEGVRLRRDVDGVLEPEGDRTPVAGG